MPQISKVPWGVNSELLLIPAESIEEGGFHIFHPFLLAVGTVEIRKNFGLLIQVVQLAEEMQIEIPLIVIVGKAGWGTEDLRSQLANNEHLEGRVLWLENVSDSELISLYRRCEALLSPSFVEGYGLPIVESQIFAKKLILSDIPIYRELFPSAQFASPFDPKAWLDLVLKIPNFPIPSFHVFSWNEVANIFRSEVEEKLSVSISPRSFG